MAPSSFVSFIVVVALSTLSIVGAQSVPTPGVSALLSLWGDTDGPNSWCLSCPQVNPCGWNASSTPCSQTVGWSGVGCGGGGNVLLNLPTSCISGTLPAALFPANSGVLLTELVVNGNSLQGPLPSEMFTFNAPTVPGDGGPLLLTFVGSDNAQLLSSGLPATFATSILQKFRCSNCGLQTPPTAVPQVVNTLELADNALTSFPFNTIFPAIPLQTFDLQRNAITGALPTSELETLSTLLSVRLDGNQFTGTLPSTYANMPQIAELGLSSNSLSGPIPSEWGFTGGSSSPQVQRIRLAGNSLTGTIPTQLGTNAMLFELTLGSNSLQGTLPSELASLNVSNVRGPVFDVSNAGLSGPIPTHYEAWGASQVFASADQCDFRGNSFTCVPTPLRQGGFCQFDASLCDCDASGTACAAPVTPAPCRGDDCPSLAATLQVNGTALAGRASSRHVRWFVFSATARMQYTVTLTFVHSSGDLDLSLFSKCRSTPESCTQAGTSTSATDNEQITITPSTDGRLWLEVYGCCGASTLTFFTIRVVSYAVPRCAAGDCVARAVNLGVDTTPVAASVDGSNVEKWYKLTLVAHTEYRLDVQHVHVGGGGGGGGIGIDVHTECANATQPSTCTGRRWSKSNGDCEEFRLLSSVTAPMLVRVFALVATETSNYTIAVSSVHPSSASSSDSSGTSGTPGHRGSSIGTTGTTGRTGTVSTSTVGTTTTSSTSSGRTTGTTSSIGGTTGTASSSPGATTGAFSSTSDTTSGAASSPTSGSTTRPTHAHNCTEAPSPASHPSSSNHAALVAVIATLSLLLLTAGAFALWSHCRNWPPTRATVVNTCRSPSADSFDCDESDETSERTLTVDWDDDENVGNDNNTETAEQTRLLRHPTG